MRLLVGLALAFLDCKISLAANFYKVTPSDYLSKLRKLVPGDVLELSSGEYRSGLPIHGVVGLSDKPILVQGPKSRPWARFVARPGAHTVSIVNSAHVIIRNLELDGQGLAVSGVRAEGHSDWAHNITLENLFIHGHGRSQSVSGISTFCPTWDWQIRGNTILGAGTGIYLGQSDGSAPFISGVIESNVVTASIGYNLQIKHQRLRTRIEGMPYGKSVTIVRKNVFSKSANSSSGSDARPNVLVGHWPLSGFGHDDHYAIYGNIFYQNPSEALFQGEGNVSFYRNVMINLHGDAILIRPHNDLPRRIDVFGNTILALNVGISLADGDPSQAQRAFSNAVFASKPLIGGEQRANFTASLAEAPKFLVDPFASPSQLDLSPRSGKLKVAVPRVLPQLLSPEGDRDFDGRPIRGSQAGAYAAEGAERRLFSELRD